MATKVEWAWAAGLFEGEGCMVNRPVGKGNQRNRMITVTSTDRDVLERFQDIVNAGSITVGREAIGNWKKCYKWTCGRWSDSSRIVQKMLPWFHERRTAAAHEFLAHPIRTTRLFTHCKRGHPLEGEGSDVYRWKRIRSCRHCVRARRGVVAGGRPRGHKAGCTCRPCVYLDARQVA